MSTSFVDYKENGFWIDDDILAITLAYIYKILLDSKDKSNWMIEMQELFKENGKGLFRGFTHLQLNDFLINEERETIFYEIIKETRNLIISKGDIIDVEELNNLLFDTELKDVWKGRIEALRILKVIDYLEMLVKGEIKIKVSDPIDYFF
ncbi:hypothetical protein GO495_21590 [Chitinophaga oryziterrae]|uniref:Uncharacterized protein n=1 Tax=Chitinophaga oryziterrae TaxID=1031224 RepID=A0A6N8JD10_9BACT|nr:hypothetical protein [Chitinophaga oryziterrae]MVT43205.1 hypothetical protein [Chitinophaga oryziterrae]